jgi:thiol-disulfide isomerase/thioredoxin
VRARRVVGAAIASVFALALLAACTQAPSAADPGNGGVTSSGSPYKEIPVKDRKDAVTFSSTLDTGKKFSSSSLLGTVHVVNFWYAGCAPCFQEAPLLEKVYQSYGGKIPFLGVNTYDQAPTAQEFERQQKVTYPSVIDVNTTSVQLAFSNSGIPANAVPSTLIIDKHGRVAARVTGELTSADILTTLIDTVVHEGQ